MTGLVVRTLLVFGCLPRFPPTHSNVLQPNQRMKALNEALGEMASIKTELRIREVDRSPAQRQTETISEPWDKVKVFRETVRKYVGTFLTILLSEMKALVL